MYTHFGLLSVHNNMYTHFGLLSVTQQHVHTLCPAVKVSHTMSCCQSLTHSVLLSKPHTLFSPPVKASHTLSPFLSSNTPLLSPPQMLLTHILSGHHGCRSLPTPPFMARGQEV